MSHSVKLFASGAKIGVLGGLYCGLAAAAILFINNPMFIDNLFGGVLFFVVLPALLGGFLGAIAIIPVSFSSANKDPHLIKQRGLFVSLVFPVLVFCVLLGTSFFILIKNNFLDLSDGLFFTLFLVMIIIPPFWAFRILRSQKRRVQGFVKTSNIFLLFILIVMGISGIVFVSQRYISSTKLEKKRIMVIAIGGADWKVVNPLLKENSLSNIAELIRNGSYGALESLENLASAVTWASGATGCLPEKHGVSSHGYSSNSYRMKPFWEVAEQYGMSVGIFEYVTTWPPQKTNGYVISGWDALDEQTFPNNFGFLKRLEKMEKQRNTRKIWDYLQLSVLVVKNGLRLETIMNSVSYIYQEKFSNLKYMDRNYKVHCLKLALTSDIFTYLDKRYTPNVSVYYNGATDGVGHFYWRFFEPEKFNTVKESEIKKYGHVLTKVYKKMDESIGKILQGVDESTTVVIFSNHGLKASPNHPGDRTHYLLHTQNLFKLLDLSNDVLATQISRVENLYVNSGKMEDLNTLIELLKELEVEKTHQKLIDFIRIDKGLKVVTITVNPEAVIDEEASIIFRNVRCKIKDLVERAEIRYSAVHDHDGIILIKGPNVRKGYQIKDATLLDVAPTILAILGLPSETAMDGKVLIQLFDQLPPLGS